MFGEDEGLNLEVEHCLELVWLVWHVVGDEHGPLELRAVGLGRNAVLPKSNALVSALGEARRDTSSCHRVVRPSLGALDEFKPALGGGAHSEHLVSLQSS